MEAKVNITREKGRHSKFSISFIIRWSLIGLLATLQCDSASTITRVEKNYVVCLDESGSMEQDIRFTAPLLFFDELILKIEKNGGGTLYVTGFSSKNADFATFVVQNNSGFSPYFKRGKQIHKYEYDKRVFLQKISQNIVNRSLSKRNNFSYIQNTLHKVRILLNQPNTCNCQNYILIHSDLIDHTPNSSPKLISRSELLMLTDCNAQFYFSGCSYDLNISELQAIRISDYRYFIQNVN